MVNVTSLGVGANLNGAKPFSPQSEWNIRVDQLPLDPNSAKIISLLNPTRGLHADFGSGTWQNSPIGIPYVIVPANQSMTDFVESLWPEEGDDGPFPIPVNAPIEGNGKGDAHVIVLQQDPNAPNGLGKLYEIYNASFVNGKWQGQAAVFDMQGGDLQRPMGWTSADAAGLPIFPGLARYEDARDVDGDGTLGHALRFTLSQAHTAMSYIGAASHTADSIDGAAPFGMHVRLRPDFAMPAGATKEVQVIINTLKQYGMILADNGSDWYISGTPDASWDDDALRVLGQVKGGDFQVVNVSGIPIDFKGGSMIATQGDDNLVGTKASNVIDGLGGNDIIKGLAGNDTLKGGRGDDVLMGGKGADRLFGNGGNDILYGGAGKDLLNGGDGADSFVFNTALRSRAADVIKGFSGDDLFLLDNAVFTKLGSGSLDQPGHLTADAFHIGRAAADAQDRIIYHKSTGELFYDPDGTGSKNAVKFADVSNHARLNHHDFDIV